MNYIDLGKIRQLIQDALELENLLNLCIDEFKSVYDNFKNQGRDCIIRELVDYAYRNNEIDVLLVSIEKINPNIYQQFKLGNAQNRSPQKHSILHNFPATLNFDLTDIIDRCRLEIIDKKGLIGLSICCSNDSFLKSFCERLRQKSRGDTQVRQPLSIKPQFNSAKEAVKQLSKYKQTLNHRDVICPIRIDINNPDSTVVKDFWFEVQDSFKGEFDRRLIIIMLGERDCLFPSDVLSLPPPEFNKVHITDWISDLTSILHGMQALNGWEDVTDSWIARMHQCCQYDDRELDISLVYEHLETIISELNWLKDKPSLSPQVFLQRIYPE